MLVYMLRHGETDYNRDSKYQGRRDIPLSENGLKKLKKADFDPDIVYVSPLIRAKQTAERLFPNARQIDIPELMEMDFGIFEGRSHREMENDPVYRKWVDGMCEDRIPGGEKKSEFTDRVCRGFERIVDSAVDNGRETLVIVAHGGTQMAALERFGLPRRDYYKWIGPLAGGYVFQTDGEMWKTGHTMTLLKTGQYTEEEK